MADGNGVDKSQGFDLVDLVAQIGKLLNRLWQGVKSLTKWIRGSLWPFLKKTWNVLPLFVRCLILTLVAAIVVAEAAWILSVEMRHRLTDEGGVGQYSAEEIGEVKPSTGENAADKYFDTFFQGLAAIVAVSVAVYQLRSDAAEREKDRKDDDDKYQLQKFDKYFREASCVTAWLGRARKGSGENSKVVLSCIVLENYSTGVITGVHWEVLDINGNTVYGPENKADSSWEHLPRGRWNSNKNDPDKESLVWFFPVPLGDDYRVMTYTKGVAPGVKDGVLEPITTTGKDFSKLGEKLKELVSIRFTDCYGNTWIRTFEENGQSTLELEDSTDKDMLEVVKRLIKVRFVDGQEGQDKEKPEPSEQVAEPSEQAAEWKATEG